MLNIDKIREVLAAKGIPSTELMRQVLGQNTKQSLTYLRSRPGITFSTVEKIADILDVSIDSIRTASSEGSSDKILGHLTEADVLRGQIDAYKQSISAFNKLVKELNAAHAEKVAAYEEAIASMQAMYDKLLTKVSCKK